MLQIVLIKPLIIHYMAYEATLSSPGLDVYCFWLFEYMSSWREHRKYVPISCYSFSISPFLKVFHFLLLINSLQLAWPPLRSLNLTFLELQTIVRENDKQRFQLIPTSTETSSTRSSRSSPSEYLIRASQGHSLKIASDNLLSPMLPSDPDFPVEVVHGTFAKTWPVILESGGLRRMGRTHIHFAVGLPEVGGPAKIGGDTGKVEASKSETLQTSEAHAAEILPTPIPDDAPMPAVVSGMRRTANVLIWVDVRRSMEEAGLKWWRSANGVILTEGDEGGMVPMRFVRRVEKRAWGGKAEEVIWKPEE